MGDAKHLRAAITSGLQHIFLGIGIALVESICDSSSSFGADTEVMALSRQINERPPSWQSAAALGSI